MAGEKWAVPESWDGQCPGPIIEKVKILGAEIRRGYPMKARRWAAHKIRRIPPRSGPLRSAVRASAEGGKAEVGQL